MTASTTPTLRLLRAAQDGNQDALNDLFSRVLPRVRQIVALRIGYRARRLLDADEVLQEVLMKAFRSFDQYEERSDATFLNWLSRCAQTVVLDEIRKALTAKRGAGRVRRLSDFDSSVLTTSIFASGSPSPSAVMTADELEERIESALLELPEHHREVIVLRKLCAMSYSEIARELNCEQEGTVRQLCRRGLVRLREQLEGYFDTDMETN